jgi:D-cysteine desulfhydrase
MTASAFQSLSRLARTSLAFLPTPVHSLPNFSHALDGPDIWIKRDDQTGLATGGNKVRKLEFLMAEAQHAGATCVITAGSTQSNHARQTAAAAARCGLECHLMLYAPGGAAPQAINGNVLLDTLLGASIHWVSERAPYSGSLAQVEADLKKQGQRPHVIPYGGSSAVGMMGYVDAMQELAGQALETDAFDAIVFATSSGGTHAGMLLGAHLAGWIGKTRFVGISVDQHAAEFAPRIADLAAQGAHMLGLDWRPDPSTIEVLDGYLGGGYAVVGDPEREAIRLLAQSEGILVDPVYTGRALAGLIDQVRRGGFSRDQRVLFWHTGGSAALFALATELV